jgi:hypothetical protein
MKNIDCEIYIKQLISFFENNPGDLMELIGDIQKEEFYSKLREKSEKNVDDGLDHILSRQQMIDIVLELKIPELFEKPNPKSVVEGYVQKTKWGKIILN